MAALEAAGVPAKDISLVANKCVSADLDDVEKYPDAATGVGFGGALGGGAGLLASLGILTIPASVRCWRWDGWRPSRSARWPERRPAASWAR